MKQIVFVNINYQGNAGDFWSTPLRYYNFDGYPVKHIHFMDIWFAIENSSNNQEYLIKDCLVVIGGGGLITTENNFMQITTEYLVKNNKVIFWGVGSNTFENPSYDILYHENVVLSGIRDIVYGLNIDYLPCVSCKHHLFDKNYIEEDAVGIIEHPRHPIVIEGADKINNQSDIDNIINFLGTKSKIISSTFHGVYWSQLLNKEILYFQTTDTTNSKIINMKNRVSICNESNHTEKIKTLSSTRGMLKESRELNDNFYKKVIKIFDDFIKIN